MDKMSLWVAFCDKLQKTPSSVAFCEIRTLGATCEFGPPRDSAYTHIYKFLFSDSYFSKKTQGYDIFLNLSKESVFVF